MTTDEGDKIKRYLTRDQYAQIPNGKMDARMELEREEYARITRSFEEIKEKGFDITPAFALNYVMELVPDLRYKLSCLEWDSEAFVEIMNNVEKIIKEAQAQ